MSNQYFLGRKGGGGTVVKITKDPGHLYNLFQELPACVLRECRFFLLSGHPSGGLSALIS